MSSSGRFLHQSMPKGSSYAGNVSWWSDETEQIIASRTAAACWPLPSMDDGCQTFQICTRVCFWNYIRTALFKRVGFSYASVYLCAGLENLLEEILLQCVPNDSDVTLTASLLEHAIANNGDLWGLLQPYAHLNAGRIASGIYILEECELEKVVNWAYSSHLIFLTLPNT